MRKVVDLGISKQRKFIRSIPLINIIEGIEVIKFNDIILSMNITFDDLIIDMENVIRKSVYQVFNEFDVTKRATYKASMNIEVDLMLAKQEELIYRYSIRKVRPLRINFSLVHRAVSQIPEFKLTKDCLKAITEHIDPSVFSVADIWDAWIESMYDLAQNRMTFSEIDLDQISDFCAGVLKMFEMFYRYVEHCWYKIKKILWPNYEKILTPMTEGVYKSYDLLVSLGRINFDEFKYPVISCSYVNEQHQQFYFLDKDFDNKKEHRRIGWCFAPTYQDVIGMDPTDACVYVKTASGREKYNAMMFNKYFIGQNAWTEGVHPSFQSCYAVEDMMKKDRFNEIVLQGTTEPCGVFILRDAFEHETDYKMKALTVASEKQLPIVIFDFNAEKPVEIISAYTAYQMLKPQL